MGGSSKSGSKQDCYFGTVAALICAGPVDELVGIVVDGKLVWPDAPAWADGLIEARTSYRKRSSNMATVWMEKEHGLKDGNQVTVTGFGDASFNAAVVTVNVQSAFSFKYANTGSPSDKTADSAGRVTDNVTYAPGALVHDGATVWECVTGHTSTLANRPPHGNWAAYQLQRSVEGDAPYPITVPDYGLVDFYWGTDDQELLTDADPASARSIFIAAGHPPCRRQCWALLRDFKFGAERQAAPNVEFIVRRAPHQTAIAGDAAALDDGQANPIAAVAELVQDDVFGLGSSITWNASLQTLADDLTIAADETHLSLLLDSAESLRAIVSKLVAYYDGWFRFDANGALEAGRFLHHEAPPAFTDENTIDYHDLVEEIAWDSAGWQDTFNRTTVRYNDRQAAFKTLPAEYVSGYNRAVTGEDRRQTIDRPWIVRQDQAVSHAAELGKIVADPRLSGSLVVRAEKAASITVGDVFRLTHDAAAVSLVCRCTQKTWHKPPAGRVTLRFESERGTSVLPYAGTPGSATEPNPLPKPERISLYQFVQPPLSLTGQDFSLAVLAARTSSLTVGLKTWMQQAAAALFSELGEQRRWAITGILNETCAAADETFDIVLHDDTISADLAVLIETLSEDDISNCKVLVWVFSAADPSQFEIMALKNMTLASGVYTLEVVRGRFGTEAAAFSASDPVWLSLRTDSVCYTHDQFFSFEANAAEATFRLQSFTSSSEADLDDPDICPDLVYTFGNPWAFDDAPAIVWGTPSASPYTLATTGLLTPAADLTDAGGNLIKVELWSKNEQTSVVTAWLNQSVPAMATMALSEVFTAAGVSTPIDVGTQSTADQYFTMILRLTDAAGFMAESAVVLILAGTGGAGVGAVTFNPTSRTFYPTLNATLSVSAPANAIHYAAQAPGSSAPTSYSTHSGTSKVVALSASKRLWARASDGTNHGAWSCQDYTYYSDGGGGCLLAGTLITLADGLTRPVEAIKPGDEVLSLAPADFVHPYQGRKFWRPLERHTLRVKATFIRAWGSHYVINDRLRLTYEHPVLIRQRDGFRFISTAGLSIGDLLVTADGVERVEIIKRIDGEVTTYNFTVDAPHLYLADGIIVHNPTYKN